MGEKEAKINFLLAGLILVIGVGCAGGQARSRGESSSPPEWISELPQEKGVIHAWGSCGRTSNPKDAEEKAVDDARVSLAKTIKVEVSSLLVDIEKATSSALSGSQFIRDYSVHVNREALALSLSGSQVVSVWYDAGGKVGPKQTTYALVRLSRDDLVSGLEQLAEEMLEEAEATQRRMEGGKGVTPLIERMKEKGIVKVGGEENRTYQSGQQNQNAFQELEKELESLREK